MEKKPYCVDVAVLLLFFNRSDTFRQVFDAVKQARPSKLFLYQDGARGEKDMEGVMECRSIASDENIDWECEVFRMYQDKNYGCDPSEYISQKWAFSMVDKCIVLEDDDVPSQSFFLFCKEMLDRYEHDERISMIAGFNADDVSPGIPYDYFFTSTFSIWGWASWRRVIDRWDGQYTFLDDDFNMRQLAALIKQRGYRKDIIPMCRRHRATGKEYYESIFWTTMLFGSGLAVMPTKNMVNNVGLTTNSTHFTSDLRTTPKRIRAMFTMNRYDVSFPLKHPKYVIDNVEYQERLYLRNAWNHPWRKVCYSVEELFLNLRYGQFRNIYTAFVRRLKKNLGLNKTV